MLNIYRDKIPKNSVLWDDPELAFQGMLQMGHTFDDKLCREVMAKIDGVTVKKGEYIETTLGPTHIQKLQAGQQKFAGIINVFLAEMLADQTMYMEQLFRDHSYVESAA